MKIVLVVRNQGHVPSFKTQKSAAINRKTGQPMIVSGGKIKRWMEQCIQSFESQLFCKSQMGGIETLTAPIPRSSIASLLPADDSWKHIPEQHIYAQQVKQGEEGATIIIEKL